MAAFDHAEGITSRLLELLGFRTETGKTLLPFPFIFGRYLTGVKTWKAPTVSPKARRLSFAFAVDLQTDDTLLA